MPTDPNTGANPPLVQPLLLLNNLPVPGSESGSLNFPSDHNIYNVSLTAGQHYVFDVHGYSGNGGSLSDPTLDLYDGHGGTAPLAHNDDYGGTLDSHIDFTPDHSGLYSLDVGSYHGLYTGSYTISGNISGDDVGGDIYSARSITPGEFVSSNIDYNSDHDYYRVSLTPGQHYTFDVFGNTLSDPYLDVRNNQGALVTYNDDYGGTLNSHVDFTPVADPSNPTNTYYLDVHSYHELYSGSYVLT
jgi:hypothetical protein